MAAITSSWFDLTKSWKKNLFLLLKIVCLKTVKVIKVFLSILFPLKFSEIKCLLCPWQNTISQKFESKQIFFEEQKTMGNILQRFSANRGSMTLHTPNANANPNPDAEPSKNVSDQNCEKSPAPLPVDEGTFSH